MDRTTAERLVGKLRCVTEARGATPGEARTAAAKADALSAKYGVTGAMPRPRERPQPRRPARAQGQGARWAIFDEVAHWEFDVTTGKGSPNVKVHRYQDRANWHIEIEL